MMGDTKRAPGAKRRYEESPADIRQDKRGAKALGVTQAQYERTARDKREDAAGQRRLTRSKK